MAVVAITGLKGGVGKTTLAANLAGELAAAGRTVAVLDADPQESLIQWAGLGEGLLSEIAQAVDADNEAQFVEAVNIAAMGADHVLIDCPPGFREAALYALRVADLALLPAGPSPLDILAARDALALALEERSKRGGRKPVIRFVPCRVQSATMLGRELADNLEALGAKALPPIGLRAAIAQSAIIGLTIREFAPSSTAAEEFNALAREVERLL